MKKLSLSVLAVAMGLAGVQAHAANAGYVDGYYVIKTEVEIESGGSSFSADDDGFGVKGEYGFEVAPDMHVLMRAELQQGDVESSGTSADLNKWSLGTGLQFGSNPRIAGILDYSNNELEDSSGSVELEGFGLHARAAVDVIENLELVAQIGYTMMDLEAGGSSVDTEGPAWLLGAAYNFTPTFGAFVDYRSSDSDVDNTSDTISLTDVRIGARFLF